MDCIRSIPLDQVLEAVLWTFGCIHSVPPPAPDLEPENLLMFAGREEAQGSSRGGRWVTC